MAWITSATSGIVLTNPRWTLLKAVLLLVHMTLLTALWRERSHQAAAGSADQAAADVALAMDDPATLAILTGLLLALLLIARRWRRSQDVSQTGGSDTEIRLVQRQAHAVAEPPRSIDFHDGLIARLHHDLRTPLNAMIGFADLMKAETFGPLGDDRYRAYAAHMQSCSRDLLEVTETTLTMAALLARGHCTDGASTTLGELLETAWRNVCQGSGAPAPELVITDGRGLVLRGDHQALRQAMVSLLSAARSRCTLTGAIDVSACYAAGRIHARISVADSTSAAGVATTGCRPSSSACPSVEDMPTSVSRTLLGLQGIPLAISTDATGTWTASLALEAAEQSDLFAEPVAQHGQNPTGYPQGFFGAASLSVSA